MLPEFLSKEEIGKLGIRVPPQKVVKNIEALEVAVRNMKYPLALKIHSADILHKSDVGGVKLNIRNIDEARSAYEQIMANVTRQRPGAKLDGILVQEMAPDGVEMIVGVTRDAQFGPMVLAGSGGIFVEIFKDVAIYPAPMGKPEALDMLNGLKGFKLLDGYRGARRCDVDALADLIVKISSYACQHREELKELDLNPVFVYPHGQGVLVADAMITKYKTQR